MITFADFENLVLELLGDNLADNPSQRAAISYDEDDVLMLVAGPGSGKTRVLVLRALRHVLVDNIFPENIVITTFTRKSAKELRTRWLDWGTVLLETLRVRGDENIRQALDAIDINRCRIDTLDSIAEQALTEYKLPGEVAPIILEKSASKLVLKRQAFAVIYRANPDVINPLLARYTMDGLNPRNQGEALGIVQSLCDRLVQDRVQLDAYSTAGVANQMMMGILTNYHTYLSQTSLYDFAFLELVFLERLMNGTLADWCEQIEVLLVDEYQDTNSLQEQIYFEIIRNGSPYVAIVGDDDQSMYRFRGGSVELFTEFADRCRLQTQEETRRIDMVTNYRSSAEIVAFYNRHITGDTAFAPARIVPAKSEVNANRGEQQMPILGMFRANTQQLAVDLAQWISTLITNRESIVGNFRIRLSDAADVGDFVLLSHSVHETKYNFRDANPENRFPGYLRDELEARNLQVFNPRGRALRTVPDVQILLGLLLLCLDPDGTHVPATFPTNEAAYFLNVWRRAAIAFIARNPNPCDAAGIRGFINAWQNASRPGVDVPRDWPVLELIFTLITWLPSFQNETEHQVWLEAITSVVANAGMASPYGMQILQFGQHRDWSRQSLIRDALVPIAEDEVEVDEEIMPSIPRNRLQLMTIHQAKGLEFPLVIVDVGSHFASNHWKQRFLRFPTQPSNVAKMEDDVEPFLPAPLRGSRPALDRTFDDLVRLYYVAFSRPQSVLLLIGCDKCLSYGKLNSMTDGAIPNVALGWNRNGTWPWRQPFTGRSPVLIVPPFLSI